MLLPNECFAVLIDLGVGDPCTECVQCYCQKHPCEYGTQNPHKPHTTGPRYEDVCKARSRSNPSYWSTGPTS